MEIAERFDVKKIGLFGSFVRGEQKRGSDVDILVEYSELPNLLEFVRLERYLEGILKKKVDLVEKSSLRDELKKPIGKEIVFI
ncbi:MAG: nucleotidyltransferase [Deltaproteobacteria bacterium GWC2_56_8]|nr:MAG: nucleotidyltransferase [Deltaproteobacteria bacterium GWB2_55_19]OGP36850.1 MAG: nucleotidyltransferase [Deltaproteobacteria bacterium GWC2_56_8]